MDRAFEQHFQRTSTEPTPWQRLALSDEESNYDWEREGDSVVVAITNAADIPSDAAIDIQAILNARYEDIEASQLGEETEFSEDAHYEEKSTSDREWLDNWLALETSLKTEARFFSSSTAAHLAAVFNHVDQLSTGCGLSLVVSAGPQSSLSAVYRARVFQAEADLEEALCRPDLHLGPPPSAKAYAGRMNAYGISVFYGAEDPRAAVAEVRPPVGSRVAVARFEIIREVSLLDLSALGSVAEAGSIFDDTWAGRLERAAFLRSLSQRITRPVMPNDEASGYLITQAIADFLATENVPQLDGILFPSAQGGGGARNICLFHKSARVDQLDMPDGATIEARTGYDTDEGWEIDYSVTETVPSRRTRRRAQELGLSKWGQKLEDCRPVSLRVDPVSVNVHVIHEVDIVSKRYAVHRHRVKRSRVKF